MVRHMRYSRPCSAPQSPCHYVYIRAQIVQRARRVRRCSLRPLRPEYQPVAWQSELWYACVGLGRVIPAWNARREPTERLALTRTADAQRRGAPYAMSFFDILPIILVIAFWILLGIFAVWFSRRALHAPTEGELEAQHAESVHATKSAH